MQPSGSNRVAGGDEIVAELLERLHRESIRREFPLGSSVLQALVQLVQSPKAVVTRSSCWTFGRATTLAATVTPATLPAAGVRVRGTHTGQLERVIPARLSTAGSMPRSRHAASVLPLRWL